VPISYQPILVEANNKNKDEVLTYLPNQSIVGESRIPAEFLSTNPEFNLDQNVLNSPTNDVTEFIQNTFFEVTNEDTAHQEGFNNSINYFYIPKDLEETVLKLLNLKLNQEQYNLLREKRIYQQSDIMNYLLTQNDLKKKITRYYVFL